jgi:hypothetical protein
MCTAHATQSQTVYLQYKFEMGKQYLDLFPELTRLFLR